jgi:hypothetical protein
MQDRKAGEEWTKAACPQPPIENQADSTVVSRQIPAASPAPRIHKPKKPGDNFFLSEE